MKPSTMKLRMALCLGASALIASPAFAQEAEVQAAPSDVIVVIGERAINQAAIDRKAAASGIYESVNIDDIGRLPDLNLPDAYRRIAGVTAIFDEDEGRFVTARGVPPSFNFVTFDGAAIATIGGFGDGSRDVNLESIPSTAVSRLEVFKTFTPNIDLGATGGYFNVSTRSAFDQSDSFFLSNAGLTYYSFDDVPSSNALNGGTDSILGGRIGGQAEFTYSNHFGSNDQFGIVLSGSYFLKTRDEEKVIPDNYRFIGADANQDGLGDIAVPERFRWYVYSNRAQRYGGALKLEWRPGANTYLSFNNYVYNSQEDETRTGHQIRGIGVSDITMTSPTTGEIANAFGELTFNYFPLDYRYTGHIANLRHEFDNGGQLTGVMGFTTAQIDDFIPEVFLRTPPNRAELGGQYDLSGGVPSFSVNDPGYWSDTTNYSVLFHRLRHRFAYENVWDGHLEYAFNADNADEGFGFQLGGGLRSQVRKRDIDMTYFASGYGLPGDITSPNRGGYTPPGRDGVPYVFLDYNKFFNQADLTVDAVQTIERSLNDDFKYREDIASLFGLTTYGGQTWRVTGGLRFEDVDVSSENWARTAQSGVDQYVLSERNGGYNFLAPSLEASYSPFANVRLRAASSQTLGRPNPAQIASTSVVSADGLTVSRGNPDLQPRESNNFDLGLEYYFDEGDSLFALAVFYKDISNEIVTRSRDVQLNGETVSVTEPVNAENSEVFGVELTLIKDRFDMLPGAFANLGFSGNLTYTDAETVLNSGVSPVQSVNYLSYQPEWFGNATFYYNWSDLAEARLAYNYQGQYHSNTTSSVAAQSGVDGYGQLDFSARYSVDDRWTVRFDAKNLTDENRNVVRGPNLSLLRETVEFGQSFMLGVSYRR